MPGRQSPWQLWLRRHTIFCRTCPYSLSPEPIEEIALCLPARDISSLARSCKRFHDIVGGSLPIAPSWQAYIIHYMISHGSIVDRMGSLRRWEAPWIDMGRHLSAVLPRRDSSYLERGSYSCPFFLREDYTVCLQSFGSAARQVCTSLHSYTQSYAT